MSFFLLSLLPFVAFSQTWTIIFEDDFNGNSVNESNWTPTRHQSHGYPYEEEIYLEQNVLVQDGNLVLVTKYQPYYDKDTNITYNYTSGVVTSQGKFSATYGKWEVRAKLPTEAFKHAWPAIWFQKESGDCYQEIDLMEQWIGQNDNEVKTSYHYNPTNDPTCSPEDSRTVASYPPKGQNIDFSQDFHVWEMIWNKTMVEFFIDSKMIGSMDSSSDVIPYESAYIILNVAVCGADYCGGTTGIPTNVTGYMYVDYVKVYELM